MRNGMLQEKYNFMERMALLNNYTYTFLHYLTCPESLFLISPQAVELSFAVTF